MLLNKIVCFICRPSQSLYLRVRTYAAMKPIANFKVEHTQLFINNEWVDSASGKTFPTINPATLETVAEVQEADKTDVDKAVKAARQAFKLGSPWRVMSASKRGELLNKLADLMKRDAQKLGMLETLDNGKPFAMSSGGVFGDVKMVRYTAGAADKIVGETLPIDGDFFAYTRMEPIGVCGLILPWNWPISMFVQKAAYALAAGCTVVVKPAEQTPLSALHIALLCKEAGFPAGVVNVLPGYGPTAGSALTHHMDVDMVSFTGSTEVGKMIMKASGESNLKKVGLELGGKSPNIVFSDVNMDYAVELSHQAIMINQGQICCGGSRTFVHEDIYDEFVKRSAERANKRTVGDPFDPKNENGPQVDGDQFDKVLEMIESGKKEGAKLQAGGQRAEGKGYFVQPTVFSDVTEDMRIAREEIFGPVQSIFKFKTIEEAIEKANNTTYGLAATVITKDIEKALTIANSVNAGSVWVNTTNAGGSQAPFGGYKMSGIGRERGKQGLEEFCEVKTVVVKTAKQPDMSNV